MSNLNRKPDSNLVWAILCTFFCCLPLGIVSIVYASKVDGLYRNGDYEAAQEAADNALKYAKYGAIGAGVILILYFLIIVAGAGIAASM